MVTAFLLLQFTAQRPTDVLRMARPAYSGEAIRLRQQKTGVVLDVPIHPLLRAHLDALPRKGPSMTIITYRGRPVPYTRFNERFRRIAPPPASMRRPVTCAAQRCCAWPRGATVPQIASVSGHSIEATQRILETYLPRNYDLAEIAIARLADYQKRGPNRAPSQNGV